VTTLILTITVPDENNEVEAIDAINETLNTLAREDVLDDDLDDAWSWQVLRGGAQHDHPQDPERRVCHRLADRTQEVGRPADRGPEPDQGPDGRSGGPGGDARMRRTIRIDIEVYGATMTPPNALDKLTDAVADYVAREWDANTTASVVYDSDGDPAYQQEHNR